MIIVSDTTAITNLLKIGRLEILRAIYQEVIVPTAVYRELSAIAWQKEFMATQPWIRVATPVDLQKVKQLSQLLGQGESESIVLALELHADYLVIDELAGREVAEKLGVRIIGLLGVLLESKRQGVIAAIKPVIDELRIQAGFRIHPSLYQQILKVAGE